MDKKNDVSIAKLNESDLPLFVATNSSWSKRPLKVKANGTVITYESDAIVELRVVDLPIQTMYHLISATLVSDVNYFRLRNVVRIVIGWIRRLLLF
jgi:hypothetical protein